ncbi:coenzyme F420-0:L-glutamate ligase/coenzyme F420-1:gamma-L-glutamate ligase [Novosphingobium chloroacetimidivorans]|uniref:Coenzyme F420-0:L-glutamate ligase/coenzyme F420-1:gamma-L-glutamate ligase n=1 Tax=Novosphingobium chloroacetimidivorans TaxID=1428314 RepID=A0A7W7NXA8_9SPHN|nr:coenzyme F420-0:L-glutamate ligase [Novosphingobium chloroacetimidivorans]MBB4858995.1 coenzyme F420-0:L-glutamate ligase/coenzyme F420-1:gamma-L-glutamate ligase [Novosphingobium chloroacetimidivorans]
MTAIRAISLHGMPLFAAGTDVAREVCAAIDRAGEVLASGDIVVVAQKIVSKREGRLVALSTVEVGEEARRIAAETGREPEMVQLILDESTELLRTTPVAIVARHRTGHVLANAGIDASNVDGGDSGTVLLWPVDPDASARALRAEIAALTGVRPAVVIADSMGRAWRVGTVGTAIGCAGLTVVEDRRGTGVDLFGRTLQATQIAVADSIAAIAALAMGESDEGTPAALVRGCGAWVGEDDGPGAASGLRPIAQDMFR